MTRLRIRDYEPEDFLDIEVMEPEKQFRLDKPLAEWAFVHKHAGPCYTIIDPEGRIVACGGIHDVWPGMGTLWLVLSVLAFQYPYLAVALRKILSGWQNGYHRIQAMTDMRWKEAVRFNEHFGFRTESILRHYGQNMEDYGMFAWVKES